MNVKDPIYDIQKLENLLAECIYKFSSKKRFIHPRTISNFIFHFYSFKDKTKKDLIYLNLKEVLEIMLELDFEDLTPAMSSTLFNQYIYPIVNYYSVYKNFSIHFKGITYFIVVVVGIGLVNILKFSYYYYFIVIFIVGILFLYNRYKERLNKTYGNFY
ncbi:MAG: hypothetical protein KBF82_10610 [Chitinophagaceae bacterium]|nr:hypothetical protein [Chitinophagaceae bacterium]